MIENAPLEAIQQHELFGLLLQQLLILRDGLFLPQDTVLVAAIPSS